MRGVQINLGGQIYELKFTMNVMCDYEELTGKNALTTNIFDNLTASNIRNILFSFLRDIDDKITLKDVGALVTPDNIEEVLSKMIEAYNKAKPEASGEENKKKVNQLN